jgi:aflatoxin B1 aldehyde reductase
MAPNLVFGGNGIGKTDDGFVCTWDTPEKLQELLALLKKLNILEIDSAAGYPIAAKCPNAWNTETLLGQVRAVDQGFIIDTKVAYFVKGNQLGAANIGSSLARSLELLQAKQVRTLYNHAMDKQTPLEETALAFHEQFKAGGCERVSIAPEVFSDKLRSY